MDLTTLRATLNSNFFNITHNQWAFMVVLSAIMAYFLVYYIINEMIRTKQEFNAKGDKMARGFIYLVTSFWLFVFAISLNKLLTSGITHIHFTVDFSF